MGTPPFAATCLRGLLDRDFHIPLVVSQPDRPAGRGRQPTSPAVATLARERGIDVFQPESLRPAESVDRVRAAQPDVIVVAAYGLILRQDVLTLPAAGCVNVHASLLPRHRGASPISAAILAGDAETGVCLMRMERGLDTGPVYACTRTPMLPTDDTPQLTERLAALGADLLATELPRIVAGATQPTAQDQRLATYAPRIERADARLDWTLSAAELHRRVRAYRGWPDAFTTWRGKQLKVLRARPLPDGEPTGISAPGTVIQHSADQVAVSTGDGLLELHEVALEGKRATDGAALARGYRDFVGSTLGG